MTQYNVFFLSDHTGITVEMLGRSLLTQFEDVDFCSHCIPYIDDLKKIKETRDKINAVYRKTNQKPLVLCSMIDGQLKEIIQQSDCFFLDLFDLFIPGMEKALGRSATFARGRTHGLLHQPVYHSRINAVDFTLANDDGANLRNYDDTDLILIGVSRTGKTPTCLYMALQFGIRAANYPLTDIELESQQLPKALRSYRNKIFGLTIDADHLQSIRKERLPNSSYATINQCRQEITAAEELYQIQHIPFINSTAISIEEIATNIMVLLKLQRRTL
jgi:[pyruvate, water dikinase]-phosphate phosphotransferase / [pyruvate, water dikinase] kinase